MTGETWIVVANSSRARIFRAKSKDALEELDGLVHSASRLREGDIVSDRKGRSFNRLGGGRHALEQELQPHQQEAVRFAGQLAAHLKESLDAKKIDRLHLAAGPYFLGLLRAELDPHVTKILVSELDKDLTELTPREIRQQFPYLL